MVDYLFIGPLGWEKNIWDWLLKSLKDKTYDFVEYLDEKDENINEVYLKNMLEKKIKLVKKTGSIIASSYGSRFLLYCMKSLDLEGRDVIFIEGFEEIPEIDFIRDSLQGRKEIFKTVDEYLNVMTDEKDRQNLFIVEAVIKTLKQDEDQFVVKCSNQKMEKYLSILAGMKTEVLIDNIKKQKGNYTIFSSKKIEGVSYVPISEEEHLLMLSDPDKIIDVLHHKN